MSDFKPQFRVVYDKSNSAPKEKAHTHTHFHNYHIVAVHGLGQIGRPDSAWTERNVCWLSDILPLHSHCARVARFDYSCDSLGKGISVADIKHLARALLDKLLKEVAYSALDRIVFLGHDLGGLVIKQALSLALTTHQYGQIAAMTSLLVFFGTPHRVRSSESIASWMLFLAGEDRGYNVSWFSQTANMIEAANAAFGPFKHVYRTMSVYGTTGQELESELLQWQGLDESTATMGIPTEEKVPRNEPHDKISIFSSADDIAFAAICQEVHRSRNPGFAYIECLEYLAGFLRTEEKIDAARRHRVVRDNGASRQALDQLQQNPAYQCWSTAASGSIFVDGDLGSIGSIIQLVQSGQSTIGGSLKSRCYTLFHSAQLPALLCYQLLCLEPGLFQNVQRLVEHLCAETVAWADKIWILLRSLLSCPAKAARVCCIQNAVGDTTSDEYSSLRRLFTMAEDPALSFKLMMISPPAARTVMTQLGASEGACVVELGPLLQNFQQLAQFELDTLVAVRPELKKTREHFEFALSTHHDKSTQTFHWQSEKVSMLDMVSSWTTLLALEVSSATRLSIRLSASKLPDNLRDLYMRVLERAQANPDRGPKVLRTLFWSSRAFRPLNIQELGVAAALDLTATVITDLIDQIPINLSWDINASFCPLAYIADDQDMVVRDSFASFLAEPHHGPCKEDCLFCENNHSTMALKCLHYISLIDDADYFRSQLQNEDDQSDKTWCLLEYAVTYWPEHYKLAKKAAIGDDHDYADDVLPGFEAYFNDKAIIRKWAHLFCAIPHPLKAVAWVDPMLVAVEIGCLDLAKELLRSAVAIKPDILNTALEIAVSNGDKDLVQLFYRSGAASVNALQLAALSGRLAMLPLLPQVRDASSPEEEVALTPMHFACKSGNLEMVSELFFKYMVDLNAMARGSGSTPLHIACQYGHRHVISFLLDENANANIVDERGMTPLHVSCLWEQPLAVCALLEHPLPEGSSIDLLAADKSQTTALHFVADAGRLDILNHLTEHLQSKSKDINIDESPPISQLLKSKDSCGLTPLHRAAANGHANIVQELSHLERRYSCSQILKPDNNNNYPLHLAVSSGHLDVVDLLLDEQEPVKDQLEREGEGGACAIHLAVLHGHIDLVQRLCQSHRDKQVSFSLFYGAESQSPLHLAVDNGQVDIVRHLLNAGARPNIMDAKESTPLLYACQKGFLHIVDLLIDHKASIDTQNEKGVSPVLAAAENNHEKVVERLIDSGADIFAGDDDGNTPLMAACKRDNPQVTDLLLRAGADVNVRDRQKRGALHTAAEYASVNALKVLLDHISTDLSDIQDLGGDTPLHLAVKAQSADPRPTIDMLLKHGARPDLANRNGDTPLDLADAAEVSIRLVDKVDFDQSDASRTLQQRLLRKSAAKGHLHVIQHLRIRQSAVDLSIRNDQGQSLYHLAAQSGQLDVVKYLIRESIAGCDGGDDKGRTPAWYAAKSGHLPILKALAEAAPGSLNTPDGEWKTPLSNAVEECHFDIATYLLENRVKFLIQWEAQVQGEKNKKTNCTLYHLAAQQVDRSPEMTKLLMDQAVPGSIWKDDHERVPVVYAAMNGSLEIAKLLRRDALEGSFNQADKDGKTPLYHAVEGRHKDLVEFFIAEQVDLDAPEREFGWTALHQAANDGDHEIVDILVGASAALDVQDSNKRTPLFLAAYKGYVNVVSSLLSGHCNVHLVDEHGWSPLIAAYDNCQILELLIAAQASVDVKANDGFTALLGAASFKEDSVRLLLSKGADALHADDEGWTVLHFANSARDSAIIELLLERFKVAGRSPDMVNNKGHTPLMTAFDQGSPEIARALLKSGQFDVNHVNPDGWSIAMMATQRGTIETAFVRVLLDYGGSSLNRQQLERLLIWTTENKYHDFQSKCMDLLSKKNGSQQPPSQGANVDELFKLAVDHDDAPLIRFLCDEYGSALKQRRDRYNWTLYQINTSFRCESQSSAFDDEQFPPTGWDLKHKPKDIILDQDQLTLHRDHNDTGENISAVRANNPVRLMEKFYFEIVVIACKTECLGVGFGHQNCDLHMMPGWDNNTWGLHADDGGLFHASGWQRETDEKWSYSTGDIIGCCIDLAQRKAAFTKNGDLLGACFTAITGRVFPMVALGVGDKVVANFGCAEEDVPFRFPGGRNWVHTNEIEIESVLHGSSSGGDGDDDYDLIF